MSTRPKAFLEPPDVCGLLSCPRAHLKRPCATLLRLVGRMTNTSLANPCFVQRLFSRLSGIRAGRLIFSSLWGPSPQVLTHVGGVRSKKRHGATLVRLVGCSSNIAWLADASCRGFSVPCLASVPDSQDWKAPLCSTGSCCPV